MLIMGIYVEEGVEEDMRYGHEKENQQTADVFIDDGDRDHAVADGSGILPAVPGTGDGGSEDLCLCAC